MMPVSYSSEYLAESQAIVLSVFHGIPILLGLFTTALRLGEKMRTEAGLTYEDCLMVLAAVRSLHKAVETSLMRFAKPVSIAVCVSGLVYDMRTS